ncbi:MAG: hypothetical protein GXY42_02605 [Desulfovibrionales bacterium]|nr:hypothetical protein [Desulfovibrionales bacterium]
MSEDRPFDISTPRVVILILGLLLPYFFCGCATTPQPDLKPPAVSLGPVMDVLKVETGDDVVRLVPNPEGEVHALIASAQWKQVVHVLVREEGACEPETVLSNVSPSRLDGAWDRDGRLHALIDTIHMIREDGSWLPSARTPWTETGITPSRAGFVPGSPDLVWAFVVEGSDVGASLRMDIYGFGGGYPAAGIIWPWFTRGSRLVLAAEDSPACWNVFDLTGRLDSVPLALASDLAGTLHVLYYKSLGGLLKDMDLHYTKLGVRDLAPDAARHPEDKELKAGDRLLKLHNIAGSRIPNTHAQRRSVPDCIAADPGSGAVLIGMDLLIRGNEYTDGVRGSLPPEGGMFTRTAPAGDNTFHALVGAGCYRLLSGLEWSAPMQLGVAEVASFWGSTWEACDLASTGNGKAFATWPTPHGIMGRWITRDIANATDSSNMTYPMWPLEHPGQRDPFEPVHIVVDTPHRDQDVACRAHVLVTDSRNETEFRRTTIRDTRMSRIDLYPPVPELVGRMVETSAARLLATKAEQPPETIACDIAVFDIGTPATMLYWDVETRLELILRARGQVRTVSVSATERTWLWPSEDIIGRVAREALRQAGEGIDRTLRELLAPSGG